MEPSSVLCARTPLRGRKSAASATRTRERLAGPGPVGAPRVGGPVGARSGAERDAFFGRAGRILRGRGEQRERPPAARSPALAPASLPTHHPRQLPSPTQPFLQPDSSSACECSLHLLGSRLQQRQGPGRRSALRLAGGAAGAGRKAGGPPCSPSRLRRTTSGHACLVDALGPGRVPGGALGHARGGAARGVVRAMGWRRWERRER